MGQIVSLPIKLIRTTAQYYSGLFYYLFGSGRTQPYSTVYSPLGGSINRSSTTTTTTSPLTSREKVSLNDSAVDKQELQSSLRSQHSRIHLFSLASNFYLYNKPHYRKGSYRDDLIDNLRNVAIPGTGIALSNFVTNRFAMLTFLVTLYPTISFVSSIHLWIASKFTKSISYEYETRLLCPDDWFHYWRLNCTIVALHSLLQDMPDDYQMENKWTFLKVGDERNVPISPFLKDSQAYVIKHKNEEGGMGIYFYSNAAYNGDWIIQSKISNSQWVQSLLPSNAPLSTFRIITTSRRCIVNSDNDSTTDNDNNGEIKAVSCVFRAGRAGAATDHDSILFDVDVTTGTIKGGTTNAHWYRLGLLKGLLTGPWRSYDEQRSIFHPDVTATTQSEQQTPITGRVIPNFQDLVQVCEQSHTTLCPSVPFAGWDVVLSDDIPNRPICLLEVNLSCNFFRGSFDEQNYYNFIDDAFSNFQELRLKADRAKKVFAQA